MLAHGDVAAIRDLDLAAAAKWCLQAGHRAASLVETPEVAERLWTARETTKRSRHAGAGRSDAVTRRRGQPAVKVRAARSTTPTELIQVNAPAR
jgi:hypothetical protein